MYQKHKNSILFTVGVAALLICIGSGWIALREYNRVCIGGALTTDLIDGKDFIADILPPPGYIVEANLVAAQLLELHDEESRRELIGRFVQLKDEFDRCGERWRDRSNFMLSAQNDKAGELYRTLENAHGPGDEFFSIGQRDLLPAIEENDIETARSVFVEKMAPSYQSHRQGIDEIVRNAEAHLATVTNGIDQSNSLLLISSFVSSSTLFLLFVVSAWQCYRTIRQSKDEATTVRARLLALDKVQATIEFNPQGEVVAANENFLSVVGYTLDEIVGQHHRMFVCPSHVNSPEYHGFWQALRNGQPQVAEYRRFGKGGKEVWVQASYNPIFDENGDVVRIVQFAIDITHEKLRNADFEGQVRAINETQAVIEFDLEGNILTANDNFLKTLGYQLDEVKGRHHRMFVTPALAESDEYKRFWDALGAGRYQSDEFMRMGKGGKQVWIRASYNPIFDLNGKPFKVVKYATEITAAKQMAIAVAERQKQDELDAQSLREKVAEILQVAEKVSIRDYSHPLSVRGEDAIGQLGQGLASFFDEKQRTELAEQQRTEQERAIAEETTRKVAVILDVVNAVASGDFTVQIPDLGDDAVGQVASALGSAVLSMRNALTEVTDVAGTVASAAQQLTEASGEISSGAQSQASSLEETASSLEEITSTIKQNTDNSQQARQLANGSKDIAERGGSVVTDAVKAMGEINQSSKKIADIITTIDEIAFQTNLLALNAAVEAARAGEQGRGFAVVAAEVRNLAQRSASAAKEIKTLIQDSVHKVEVGTDLVNRSGQTLNEIVTSVKRVTDIVSEIAAASREQLAGVEQVNMAVSQMDRVTQGNAAQTEEMSGTAGALLAHATQLSELVGGFRLNSDSEPVLSRQTVPAKAKTKRRPVATKSKRKSAPIVAPVNSFAGNASEMLLEF
jgi:methyl-accepting chemotaxis protein